VVNQAESTEDEHSWGNLSIVVGTLCTKDRNIGQQMQGCPQQRKLARAWTKSQINLLDGRVQEATELGKRAKEIKDAALALQREERAGSKGRKWKKNVNKVQQV
jgi:hypothetical protein